MSGNSNITLLQFSFLMYKGAGKKSHMTCNASVNKNIMHDKIIQGKVSTTKSSSLSGSLAHIYHRTIYQRTSGPVNAHLTPGPGMYFNAFIHAGADNPLGTNVDANRKPLSLCPFVASFKIISLKYDFKYILNDFIHVYSPKAGTDNAFGTKF